MPISTSEPLKARLRNRAQQEGFAACRVCSPDSIPKAPARLARFVALGRHGQMGWMADRMGWRANPAALWPEARSIVMLAEPYTQAHDPLAVLKRPDRGAISVYAQNRDYHDVLKKRLKRVGRWFLEQAPGEQIKVFVDTAPVMEKPLAQAAGLGWQGKHTNLLARDLGNWFFLGVIFTTVALPPDPPEHEHCGSCTACLDACPTGAFPAPFQLDARRCVSYLTIEHKGPVPADLRHLLGNRIYGCDDCLGVCPWNKFAAAAYEVKYKARPDLIAPPLAELCALDDAAFRARFSGSPIKRLGRGRFVRNVCYAIGNSGDQALYPAVRALVADADPVVADAACWALDRLSRCPSARGVQGGASFPPGEGKV
ncbi:epoxyqueuosine reductase [Rhodovulum imhoffii]|uniref:Epoxyqueuosine reductase n=1 Tax=Rhodovulum imhoffii TaxID=365340 RepID=A0A2T5BP83_9RHOB|nr:tRNA epoxyqueuosine(34) reductase QueG [Rhodovulum imhoffii]MBK5932907.1 tRNA epoxyqueuosine(34) reductase QueG [Rhodovulum imhoffii]PTN00843.1 epoxyqueuosine reductase [Rhodovulum imhoffii]